MVEWVREIDLTPDYEQCDSEDPIAIKALAALIVRRLSKVKNLPGEGRVLYLNRRRKDLIKHFLTVAQNPETTKDDFNRVMVWLYDWADETINLDKPNEQPKKNCWIKVQD